MALRRAARRPRPPGAWTAPGGCGPPWALRPGRRARAPAAPRRPSAPAAPRSRRAAAWKRRLKVFQTGRVRWAKHTNLCKQHKRGRSECTLLGFQQADHTILGSVKESWPETGPHPAPLLLGGAANNPRHESYTCICFTAHSSRNQLTIVTWCTWKDFLAAARCSCAAHLFDNKFNGKQTGCCHQHTCTQRQKAGCAAVPVFVCNAMAWLAQGTLA